MIDKMIVVIYCNEDGDTSIYRMPKSEFLQKLKLHHWGEDPKFAPTGTVPNLDHFVGLVVVDGDVVEPKPIQTVTEFTL